jgi:hypothetical protein
VKLSDGFGYADLELILESSRAEDRQVLLDKLARSFDLILAVVDGSASLVVRLTPLGKLSVFEVPTRDAERPETGVSEVFELLRRFVHDGLVVVGGETLIDDAVGALADEEDAAVGTADEGAHALASRVEGEGAEGNVAFSLTESFDLDLLVRAVEEDEAGVASGGDEGGFIGRLGFVLEDVRVRLIGALDEDGMADGESSPEGSEALVLLSTALNELFGHGRRDESDLVLLHEDVVEASTEDLARLRFTGGEVTFVLRRIESGGVAPFPLGGSEHGLRDSLSVGNAADGALLKLHDVLGERAGLVGEDVLDLAEVVGDVPRLRDARVVQLDERERKKGQTEEEKRREKAAHRLVVHVDVRVDEVGLNRLDEFDGDDE